MSLGTRPSDLVRKKKKKKHWADLADAEAGRSKGSVVGKLIPQTIHGPPVPPASPGDACGSSFVASPYLGGLRTQTDPKSSSAQRWPRDLGQLASRLSGSPSVKWV